MKLFDELEWNTSTDAAFSAEASGFLKQMESFEFLFMLTMIIKIIHKIEHLNEALQNSQLSVINSFEKVDAVSYSLAIITRWKIWNETEESVTNFDIKEAELPRRKINPKRLDNNSDVRNHVFQTPKDMYR